MYKYVRQKRSSGWSQLSDVFGMLVNSKRGTPTVGAMCDDMESCVAGYSALTHQNSVATLMSFNALAAKGVYFAQINDVLPLSSDQHRSMQLFLK